MPQTMSRIDLEAANRAHPTTVISPSEEEQAEQSRRRWKVVAVCAAAGVGALAVAGGVFYAYRAGWIGSPPPRNFARRTLDAVGGTLRKNLDAVGGTMREGYDAAGERWRSLRSA